MDCTIIAFPTLLERDDREFERHGTSNFIRAVTEGPALWDEVRHGEERPEMVRRVGAFAALIGRLEQYRSEDLDGTVELGGGMISLRLLPGLLASRVAPALRSVA
ncbi:MAG: hypothetical protein KGZ65_09385 [Sphingomonadales bacterium]|nr:hypothetical protein [Sphingomonadaceae bacterium]MBS3931436.1 hypothetical protein [Sphingomonadales bacterium]